MRHTKNVITGGVVAVAVIVGVSFLGGVQYGKSQIPTGARGGAGQYSGVATRGARGGMNGGLISGSVVSSDAQSITVSIPAGGSKIIYLSDSTQIMKSTEGGKTDLQTGTNIIVTGTANPDGSVIAQSIQIRPAGAPKHATPQQ